MAKNESVLLVDIGSASVGIAIAERNKAGVPVISHVRRVEFDNSLGQNTDALDALAVNALKKCLEKMPTVSPSPKIAEVMFAAPWYKATISVINSDFGKIVRITEQSIEKALTLYRKQNSKSLPGRTIIESASLQTYVNGYATTVQEPLRGSVLAIDYYESEVDTVFLSGIEEQLRKAFHGINAEYNSFLLTAFTVLRATRDETGFVMLDVGGEITDTALIRRGGFSFIGSFPYGTLSFLRAIAGERALADAASRATLYVRDELSNEEKELFKPTFKKAATEWMQGCRALHDTASLEMPVPFTTFLIADKEPLQWFEHILADSEGSFPIRPIVITPDFFRNTVLLGAEGNYDAFLSIAALYVLRVKG